MDKAREEIGYEPVVEADEALARTVAHYRAVEDQREGAYRGPPEGGGARLATVLAGLVLIAVFLWTLFVIWATVPTAS